MKKIVLVMLSVGTIFTAKSQTLVDIYKSPNTVNSVVISNKKIDNKYTLNTINTVLSQNGSSKLSSQLLVNRSINKRLSVNLGTNSINFTGVTIVGGLNYTYFNKGLFLLVQPLYNVNSNSVTLFEYIEYETKLNKKLDLHLSNRALIGYDFDNNIPTFTFAYTRVGVKYKKLIFGVGMDSRFFGNKLQVNENTTGVFIKSVLF